jgi:L,D-transpeptidase catalytic domain
VNLKPEPARLRSVHLVSVQLLITVLVALVAAGSDASAAGRREERAIDVMASRTVGQPVMAIVSLQSQRITIYDAKGWILRAPVSSGQSGRETPAGIFSVIEKDADHHSNLYDDASMPHMQRLTWSGIALHGGHLPGYPASHGCVRMPYDFAEELFDMTQMGMRVIVAPTDVAPVEIDHPVLFQAKPGAAALAAARKAEAEEAAKKVELARGAAGVAYRDSTKATMAVRVAENLKRRAEVVLATAETALGSAAEGEAREKAESDKAQAAAKVAELQAQLDAAQAELQPKLDAVTAAREAVTAAGAAKVAAAEAARQVMRELEPASVLISRKTQRLYVRQGFEPVLDVPVTIQDPDRPIGTHIFTAMEQAGGDGKLRWSVVSLEASHPHGGVPAAEPVSARSALDRIVIPQEALDRITGIAPRSSLIVTDEASSSETGKGTDFVVLLSGEPQGGIKMRHRDPAAEYSYARPRAWRSPYGDPFSSW